MTAETVEQLKYRAAELRQSPLLSNQRIDAMNDIASQLRFADAPLSAELSTQALQLTARNDYRRGRAIALQTLGWCHLFFDQYKEAEQELEESCQVSLDLRDDATLALAINCLGMAKRYLGDYEAAFDSHQSALHLQEKLNDLTGVASILLNFSAVHWRLGEYDQSLEYCYRGLQTATESGAFFPQINAYYGLGDLLWRVGEAAEAIQFSEQALALLRKHPNRRGESMALSNLGAAHHSRGDYEDALDNYRCALATAQAAGNIETQAEVAIRMGNVYCETNNPDQAFAHFYEALHLARNIKSRFYESQALLGLGNAQRQTGELRESVQLLERALELSQELKVKEVCYKTHLALSETYEAQNKPAAALFHHRAFHQTWNEVHGVRASRQIQRLLLQQEVRGQAANKKLKLLSHFAPQPNTDDVASRDLRTALPPRKLQQITEFIQQHLDKNINLSEFAAAVSLSQGYFHRSFKQATGKTPHQFLTEQRVERAKQLLQTTNLPISEIALRCGFSSQSHLSTHFRLHTGTTPKLFRRLR